MIFAWAACGFIAGALAYRVRGGLFGAWIKRELWSGYGTTSGRLVWAVPTAAALTFAAGVPWWWALAFAALIFAGTVLGWGSYQDLGRTENGHLDKPELPFDPVLDLIYGKQATDWTFWQRWRRDLTGMALRTVLEAGPIGALLLYLGAGPAFAAAGLLKPIVYELAWRMPVKTRGLEQGVALGEFLYGGILWSAVVYMLDAYT